MLRIIERNSRYETCVENLRELKDDLIKAGHNEEHLDVLEPKAILRPYENYGKNNVVDATKLKANTKKSDNTLVFKTKYFPEIKKLKTVINKAKDDIKHNIISDCRIIYDLKNMKPLSDLLLRIGI